MADTCACLAARWRTQGRRTIALLAEMLLPMLLVMSIGILMLMTNGKMIVLYIAIYIKGIKSNITDSKRLLLTPPTMTKEMETPTNNAERITLCVGIHIMVIRNKAKTGGMLPLALLAMSMDAETSTTNAAIITI